MKLSTRLPVPVFAAVNDKHAMQTLERVDVWDWLTSYWSIRNKKDLYKFLGKHKKKAPSDSIFMLDSGAFSAWNSGVQISLWDYIDFIKQYGHLFSCCVCLDVINRPVISEIHHRTMLKAGCENVLPVFHSGEPFVVLKKMIDWGYKHICLSPNNSWSVKDRIRWMRRLDNYFDFAGVECHILGFGSLSAITSVPYVYSYDTTTWILQAGFGTIVDQNRGYWGISEKQDVSNNVSAFRYAPDSVKDFVHKTSKRFDSSIQNLAESYLERRSFNALVMSETAQQSQIVAPDEMILDLFDGLGSTQDFGFLEDSASIGKFNDVYLDQKSEDLIKNRSELEYTLEKPAKTGSAKK